MDKDSQDLELILFDKCTIQSLKSDKVNPEELKIVSKHKKLIPDIVLIENLKRKETITKLSKLENTYWIEHWSKLAKDNLLGREIEITQDDLKEILEDDIELAKQVKLAKKVANEFDKIPGSYLKKGVDLSFESNYNLVISEIEKRYPLLEISNDPNEKMKRGMKARKSIFNIKHDDWQNLSKFVIDDLDNKPIRPENRNLKEDERTYIRNKEWIDFVCIYFQTTEEEKSQIFKRWEDQNHQNLKHFAPYAYYILALELTIGLHIIKSKGNYKREIIRDTNYLYYAHFTNVTFHTCDRKLKEIIEKIPFLKRIQKKMVYFNNDEENRPGEFNKSDWLQILNDTA